MFVDDAVAKLREIPGFGWRSARPVNVAARFRARGLEEMVLSVIVLPADRTSMKILRLRAIVTAAAIVFIFLSGFLAYFVIKPLPLPLVASAILASDDWLLTDYMVGETTFTARGSMLARKFVATYLQHNLIAHYRRAGLHGRKSSDVQTIVRNLSAFQNLFLRDYQITHYPASWPVFLAGVGFCDQVNGVAAQLLALDFGRAQSFALMDSTTKISPHTIGRVWSHQF